MKKFVYDFEVFKYDWTVIFKNIEDNTYTHIENDVDQLREWSNTHREDLFIGFNNSRYDKYIWDAILCGLDPFEISKKIIEEKKYGWQVHRIKFPTIQFDVYKHLSDRASLKLIEGNLGLEIKESDIAWDIDRSLTDDELSMNRKYNLHDVDATHITFINIFGAFKSKLLLLQKYKLPIYWLEKTNAQLTAKILGANKTDFWKQEVLPGVIDKDYYIKPKTLRLNKYNFIADDIFGNNVSDDFKPTTLDICGVQHTIGLGGLHGDVKGKYYEGKIWNVDVASYYPYLMILYNYMSRGVSNPELFSQIVEERIKYKSDGITDLAEALKLIVNTTYGCLGSNFNELFDPRMRKAVCISGQLFLIDLIEKLEPYLIVDGTSYFIQSNTDGIMFVIPPNVNEEVIKNIISEWEHRTGFNMEITLGKKMFQKDVNNYIFQKLNGEIKTKGAYTKDASLDNAQHTIVNDALINYFIHNIKPEEYIVGNHPLTKYQFIAKGGLMFKSFYHKIFDEYLPVQKINRVIAVKNKNFGCLYKQKGDGLTYQKIELLPPNCYIINDDITTIDSNMLYDELDFQFYIDMCYKRINDFSKGM